jgi:hypothetical protein
VTRGFWYRSHPEHNLGEAECEVAMQTCNEMLKTDPQAAGQSPMAY